MSYTEEDALYEEGMDYLYEQFKTQYEDEFIFNKIQKFYENNREIVKTPIQNLANAKLLFENQYYTSSFIHAAISIEVGIKSIILKPILYSLTIDDNAGNLFYKLTFEKKSLREVPQFYYDVLKDFTALNFREISKGNSVKTIWQEWEDIQGLRNKVMHEGVDIERNEAQNAIDMANYIYAEIIPTVLDVFYNHLEGNIIKLGNLEAAARKKAFSARVEKIQTALKAEHYYHGAISGELNEDTRNAIAVYKEINNLSGKSIDEAFLNALAIEWIAR